jgi:hypothetical protein
MIFVSGTDRRSLRVRSIPFPSRRANVDHGDSRYAPLDLGLAFGRGAGPPDDTEARRGERVTDRAEHHGVIVDDDTGGVGRASTPLAPGVSAFH